MAPRAPPVLLWLEPGIFPIWVILGALIYPLGAGLAMGAMRSAGFAHAIPAWAGAAILLAGLVQLSAWKCCKLAHCRNAARSIDLPVPIGNSDLSEMMEVAASPQFSFDARSANLDHSFAVCLPLASRCGTRKSGPPPPGQRLEALCETSAEADAGRPSVVAHPIASLE